jgi:hypothetical protein
MYALVVIAMLAIPASAAFAQEEGQTAYGEWYLGEIVPVAVQGFAPGERVDAYLFQPSTVGATPAVWDDAVWPLDLQMPPEGAWWLELPESQQRRWSFAETEGTPFAVADTFGIWGGEFMLPRDEAWYPCSFPLKWKCNFQLSPTEVQYHSPWTVNYINLLPIWPWAEDPADTVAPLVIDVQNYGTPRLGFQYELVITGYDWKATDIP